MRDIRDLQDRELLEKLWKSQKQTLFYTRLVCLFLLLIIAAGAFAAVWYGPSVLETVRHTESSLRKVDGIFASVSALTGENGALMADVMETLSELDAASMGETLDKLNGLDMETLNAAMEQLQKLDFEKMNAAMESLDGMDLDRLNEVMEELDQIMPTFQRIARFFGGGT